MTPNSENLYLERRDPARNMARYYALSVEHDLFGGVLAVRRWGRIGSRGREIAVPCPDPSAAAAVLADIEVSKRRRGYREPSRQSGLISQGALPHEG